MCLGFPSDLAWCWETLWNSRICRGSGRRCAGRAEASWLSTRVRRRSCGGFEDISIKKWSFFFEDGLNWITLLGWNFEIIPEKQWFSMAMEGSSTCASCAWEETNRSPVFGRRYAINCLQNNKHNSVTTTYYLLAAKRRRMMEHLQMQQEKLSCVSWCYGVCFKLESRHGNIYVPLIVWYVWFTCQL